MIFLFDVSQDLRPTSLCCLFNSHHDRTAADYCQERRHGDHRKHHHKQRLWGIKPQAQKIKAFQTFNK